VHVGAGRLKSLAIALSLVVPLVPRNLIQFQSDMVLATDRESAARPLVQRSQGAHQDPKRSACRLLQGPATIRIV
jgi:hypothetical protein